MIARFPPGKDGSWAREGSWQAALTSLALLLETLELKPPFWRRWARGGESWSWLGEGRCGINEPPFPFSAPVQSPSFFSISRFGECNHRFSLEEKPGSSWRGGKRRNGPLAGSSLFLQTFWILSLMEYLDVQILVKSFPFKKKKKLICWHSNTVGASSVFSTESDQKTSC